MHQLPSYEAFGFSYLHTLSMQAAKTLTRLLICGGLSEPGQEAFSLHKDTMIIWTLRH